MICVPTAEHKSPVDEPPQYHLPRRRRSHQAVGQVGDQERKRIGERPPGQPVAAARTAPGSSRPARRRPSRGSRGRRRIREPVLTRWPETWSRQGQHPIRRIRAHDVNGFPLIRDNRPGESAGATGSAENWLPLAKGQSGRRYSTISVDWKKLEIVIRDHRRHQPARTSPNRQPFKVVVQARRCLDHHRLVLPGHPRPPGTAAPGLANPGNPAQVPLQQIEPPVRPDIRPHRQIIAPPGDRKGLVPDPIPIPPDRKRLRSTPPDRSGSVYSVPSAAIASASSAEFSCSRLNPSGTARFSADPSIEA